MRATCSIATIGDGPHSITRALAAEPVQSAIMSRAKARSLWLAAPAFLAACSSSPSAQSAPTHPLASATTTAASASVQDTIPTPPPDTAAPTPSSTLTPASTLVPVDPTVLIPIALGNKPFPADGDTLVSQHNGYTGDPNAILQRWLVTPMAVPSGPRISWTTTTRSASAPCATCCRCVPAIGAGCGLR